MTTTVLPVTNITHLIPQKIPFVMVNTLLSFSKTKVLSSFKISENNLFVKDNTFQESGLIENMAQTVALHTGYDYFLKGEKAPTGYIGSIKRAYINKLPKLNETITTEVTILHELMGVTMVSIKVFNATNEELATAEMKTVIAN